MRVQSYEDAGGSQARDDTHLANSDHFRLHNGNGPRNSSSAGVVEPYGQLLHMTIGDVRTSGEPFVWSLHGFNFEDGKVSYKNRYVRTPYYERTLILLVLLEI